MSVPILFEDARLLIVDKPSGLPVHRTSDRDGLVEQLAASRGPLHPVHRLDAGASGALAVARDPATAAALSKLLADRVVDKRYLALVAGRVRPKGAINRPLKQRRRGRDDALARDVRTRYRLVESFAGWSLVDVRIEGGKTHQIRRHMAGAGHALAGDRRYAPRNAQARAERAGTTRLFLHCHHLAFPDPDGGGRIAVTCPLPPELEQVLTGLRAPSTGTPTRH